MLSANRIFDIKTSSHISTNSSKVFLKHSQPALLPYQEENLVRAIDQLIADNQQVTSVRISMMAHRLFYEPLHLAQKAAIFSLIDEGEQIYDLSGAYVDVGEKAQMFLDAAIKEPHTIMNHFDIPSFTASRTWTFDFMKRNRFVYKRAHFKRRGTIQQDAVENYLTKLSHAIETYGISKVLNMDETQILLSNFSQSTIAKKGQQTVTINAKCTDLKAGSTYIGTIAMDPLKRFPLYCIAHGKTEVCERKYQNDEARCQMYHSESGWCSVEVMENYLSWLSFLMDDQPFALVLDVYPTHREEDIKAFAKTMEIELIFVPANGTGQFQPLDRRIFGIVKKKLVATSFYDLNCERKDLYAEVHQRFLRIWENISDDAIKSAWEIPGLDYNREEDEIEHDI